MSVVGEKRSFDEFKLYYESTEKVTERRLEANRWNYSICVAILVAIAAITKWTFTSVVALSVGLTAVGTLATMACAFCLLWIGQIRDFKKLNNAKFAVLQEMAQDIEFDPDHPGVLVSYQPFAKEWQKLSELNALNEVENTSLVALRSSNTEYFIPKAFAVIFAATIVALAIVIGLNWPPTQLVIVPTPTTTASPVAATATTSSANQRSTAQGSTSNPRR